MKEKKEITEHDLENLEKHINTTKLRLIDMNNHFNKSLGKIRGTMFIVSLILVIIIIIGYIL
ncbi:MAG: hypothetical protein Unbinned657contig1001_54 [Prokaryotic dsDNA virus sp.]|nr:MAG: hypothetical protein Unbinned657contig1001_54 [Prokaryotic dsDNA virus sp.]|tara:strand:- start:576 stop:761 length:186 start_codon:yes stop_codon:yes gene_type:complete